MKSVKEITRSWIYFVRCLIEFHIKSNISKTEISREVEKTQNILKRFTNLFLTLQQYICTSYISVIRLSFSKSSVIHKIQLDIITTRYFLCYMFFLC